MASVLASGPGRWRLLFVLALVTLYVSVFASVSENFLTLGKTGGRQYPFGVFVTPGGGLFVQDFSYNMLFLRGIHERLVACPYQMESQAQMARIILPESGSGLNHAYSPVSFLLTLPLPLVTNFQAFLVYFILTCGGIVWLVYFYLLPNSEQPLQIGVLAVTLPSVCTLTALAIGQTGMLTTVLIGAFWILLDRRRQATCIPFTTDLALALLFWTISFKPSVAFVPFVLLAASKAWRPLAIALGLLLATWTLVCGYYGGFWTGLLDYAYLLNHYDIGIIARFGQGAEESRFTAGIFALKKDALLLSATALVVLHWIGRITLSELFQLLVWVFVLFSPYLLPSEYWILCLLIVEGSFFKSNHLLAAVLKWGLMAVIFNVRNNVGLTDRLAFPAQLILLTWLVFEIVRSRSVGPEASEKEFRFIGPHP